MDEALSAFQDIIIRLLSIDVEGFNFEVLLCATATINKSLLICLEYDNDAEILKYEQILGIDFEKVKVINCNILFRNNKLFEEYFPLST